MTTLKIIKIPQLNNVVIRQEGGHFFIAASNTFIIDRLGFLKLLKELVRIHFISGEDVDLTMLELDREELDKEFLHNENEENSSSSI